MLILYSCLACKNSVELNSQLEECPTTGIISKLSKSLSRHGVSVFINNSRM